MAIQLSQNIKVASKASIDASYGPWSSKAEAESKVKHIQGRTVGVIENGKVVEYWWEDDPSSPTSKGLIKKIENYKVEISNISYTTNVDDNTITFSVRATGKGFGVITSIYLGSNKLASMSTVFDNDQLITITAPANPGNYTYTVQVIDTILNNGAQQTCDVIWKEMEVIVDNYSDILKYTVKSFENLSNSKFTFFVYKIDQAVIDNISIIFSGNSYSDISFNQEGVYNIDMSNLVSAGLLPGDLIQVKIIYHLSDNFSVSKEYYKTVVQLTAPGVFSRCEGTIIKSVYNGMSFSATLYFEAENIGNYPVVIKDNNGNEVYNSTLLSYYNNTLTLRLYDDNLTEDNKSVTKILNVYIGDSESPNYTYPSLTLLYVSDTEQTERLDNNSVYKDNLSFADMPSGQNQTIQSFILDIDCYIPYTADSSLLFNFGNNITIDKNKISFSNIAYPTPLQQKVTLGFMCNVYSSENNENYYYNALFVNGVLVSKTPDSSSPSITINREFDVIDKISNKIRFYYSTQNRILQSCENFVLEKNYKARNPQQEAASLPEFKITVLSTTITKANLTPEQIELVKNNKITINEVEYNVIDTLDYKCGNVGNLGEEKYIMQTLLNDFCSAYNVTASNDDSDTIKNLSKKVKADPSKIPAAYLTLIKQVVNSKKLLQKYVAVPCRWQYGSYDGYLLLFTQGTSTLEYALPNFTFKFYNDPLFSQKADNVNIIPKIDRTLENILNYSNKISEENQDFNGYYNENELVAKADYMESSHLNNTPTAMFYNMLTKKSAGYTYNSNETQYTILQNPTVDKLNAVEGIPIILTIDNINYGSFMLNIAKDGKSIGFGNNGISLEGTSNEDNSQLSNRFYFSDTHDNDAKNYYERVILSGVNEEDDIDTAYAKMVANIDSIKEKNADMVDFLNGGLEYRYSAAKKDTIGDDLNEYKRILKMWSWIYQFDTYTKTDFEKVFNFDFFALYFIQMMVYGQTDNMGKNSMFDQFDEDGQWYVRPYDMDSQAGIDNNGNDSHSPAIEMSSDFSLDEDTKNDDQIQYLGKGTNRYPYSSKTSYLWKRFYLNLHSDIETFYSILRNLGYSADAVISLCEKEVITKLGIKQYNIDFKNKYLTNTDKKQQFAFGNRWIRFKEWIKRRFDFCDVYFRYSKYDINPSGNNKPYTIKYDMLPQYFMRQYNDAGGAVLFSHWGMTHELVFSGITKQNVWFSPEYIIDDDNIFQTGFTAVSPRVKLNNLMNYVGTYDNLINVVDLSENMYLQTMTINNITQELDPKNIPNQVITLTINNSPVVPRLSDYENLTSITFTNCQGEITLQNCPNLQTLNINSSTNIKLSLINCGNESNYINVNLNATAFEYIILNGCYINCLDLTNLKLNYLSFLDAESHIKIVNLYGATILTGTLDIDLLVTDTLILNNIKTVKIVNTNNRYKNYRFLGLQNAAITQWGNIDNTFDGNYIQNIDEVRMITANTAEDIEITIGELKLNNFSSNTKFRLWGCERINYVTNLNINEGGTYLFYRCTNLQSITNSNIAASGQYMFYGCVNLDTLPTNQDNSSTITLNDNNGSYMFTSCHKLKYIDIEKILRKNIVSKYWNSNTYSSTGSGTPIKACKIENFTGFMYNKGYDQNTEIDLSLYAFGINMNRCFCIKHLSPNDNTTNKNTNTNVIVTFTGTLPRLMTSIEYGFTSLDNYKVIIPSNVFENCNKVTNLKYAFAWQHYGSTYFEVPVLPNNANMNFTGICNSSYIDLTNLKSNDDKVYLPANIISCSSAFYGATFSESTNIVDIFTNCNVLENATNCFRSCINYVCGGSLKLNSNKEVNIAGIFAYAANDNIIQYGFTGNWYSDPMVSTNDYNNYAISNISNNAITLSMRVGPYYNTTITFESNNPNITISNSTKNMIGIFENAKVDNTSGDITLTFDISTKNCDNICKNLKAKTTDHSCKYIISNLKNIENANNSFSSEIASDSLLDNTYQINLPTTLRNAKGMFMNSSLITLPKLIQCQSLQDISSMFSGCIYMNCKFESSESYLPISVTNIDYLFYNCYTLYGGIYPNFIETKTVDGNPVKTSISRMIGTFAGTAILQSNTEINQELDISTMFPKVENVEGLFYWHGSNNDNIKTHIQPINYQCFSKCINCDNLFNSASYISIPSSGFDFSSATQMKFAFATAKSGQRSIQNLKDSTLSPNLSNITGLFATSGNKNEEVKNNLELLKQKFANDSVIYDGMFMGYGSIGQTEFAQVNTDSNRNIMTNMHT